MRRSILLQAALVATLATVARPAAAQNLVQNGRFDVGVAGWSNESEAVGIATKGGGGPRGILAHSTDDLHGYPGSGSLQLTNVVVDDGFPAAADVNQCLAVAAGTYTLRAYALIPSGQSQSGSVTLQLAAFSGPGCSGFLQFVNGPAGAIVGSWQQLTQQVTLPSHTASVRLSLSVVKNAEPGEVTARFDDVFLGQACVVSATRLCLDGGRFGVTASWQTPDAQTGPGVATAFTGEAGWFWFFGPGNVELVVKEVDACSFNQRRWIFLSGLTNVKVDLVVTDFETGAVKTYPNPQGQQFVPVLDTAAFATCP